MLGLAYAECMANVLRLQSLPDDDELRTVVWTGRINAQSAEFKTARFTAWLRRIDETGLFLDDLVDEVVESIGAITLFPIGACFRQQQRVPRVGAGPSTVLSLKVPERWEIRRAIEKDPQSGQFLISSYDLPLKFTSRRGEEIRGFDAPLVIAETTDGRRVVIPCSEVYRAFYAGSSDLAHAHFRQPWSKAKKRFLVQSAASLNRDGSWDWHLDLEKNVPPSIARYLCWLEFIPGAATLASQTHTSIVNQLQLRQQAWLRAVPPISSGTLWIQSQTIALHRSNAVLVTQIRDFRPDVRVAKITCTIAERVIPSGASNEAAKTATDKPSRKPRRLGKPGDRRKTQRYFELSGDPMDWIGLPRPEVTARRTRGDGSRGPSQVSEISVPVTVSVGESSDKDGAQPAAQLTPAEVERLSNRFQEVVLTLDKLLTSNEITRWIYLPIYHPVQDKYSSFPESLVTNDSLKVARWCQVDGRMRVALILQIEIRERTVYWIEIEPVPRGYKGLAIETLDGSPLDEVTVSNILEDCAVLTGVWSESLGSSARPLIATAERHDYLEGGGLSHNMFRRAFHRLTVKRAERGAGPPEESAGMIDALTEYVSTNISVPY